MKYLILILFSVVSINLYSYGEVPNESKIIINSWVCDNITVVLYSDNTCDVGELTYRVNYCHMDLMELSIRDKVFLLALFADNDDTLIIRNSDDESDVKYFIKCKKESN